MIMIRPRIKETIIRDVPLSLDIAFRAEFLKRGKEYLSLSRRGRVGVIISYYDGKGYRQVSHEVRDIGQDQEVIDDEIFHQVIELIEKDSSPLPSKEDILRQIGEYWTVFHDAGYSTSHNMGGFIVKIYPDGTVKRIT